MKKDQSNLFPASNYLDPGYQLIKTSMKEIIDQNAASVSKSTMSKLFVPIQLVCTILVRSSTSSGDLSYGSQHQFLADATTPCTSAVFQKTMTDLLSMWWESYFSKNLVHI